MRWEEFDLAEPDLAEKAMLRFEAHPHHVLATLRADGAPRMSGVNIEIFGGELWIGCMPGSRKGHDLVRDGRCAVHSAPLDEHLSEPDVRIDAVAVELDPALVPNWLDTLRLLKDTTSGSTDAQVFHLDLVRVSVVTVVGNELVIDMWDSRAGRRIVRRQ